MDQQERMPVHHRGLGDEPAQAHRDPESAGLAGYALLVDIALIC